MSGTNRSREAKKIVKEQGVSYMQALAIIDARTTTPEVTYPDFAISYNGMVRVEWYDAGEGNCGEYDPEDPNDVALYRYDSYVKWDQENPERNEIRGLEETYDDGGEVVWGLPQDGSYCTLTPVETDPAVLYALAKQIADELADALDSGNWKRRAEQMSYAEPGWVTKK